MYHPQHRHRLTAPLPRDGLAASSFEDTMIVVTWSSVATRSGLLTCAARTTCVPTRPRPIRSAVSSSTNGSTPYDRSNRFFTLAPAHQSCTPQVKASRNAEPSGALRHRILQGTPTASPFGDERSGGVPRLVKRGGVPAGLPRRRVRLRGRGAEADARQGLARQGVEQLEAEAPRAGQVVDPHQHLVPAG